MRQQDGGSTVSLPGDIPIAFLEEMIRSDKCQQQNNYVYATKI
jgi:hypothetical protein